MDGTPVSRLVLSASLLLLGAVGAAVAAVIRWAPCADPSRALECALNQDHLHDYAVVSAPFEGIPGTLAAALLSSLALTAFWAIWAGAAFRRSALPAIGVFFVLAGLVSLSAAAAQAVALLGGGARDPLVWPVELAVTGLLLVPTAVTLVSAVRRAGGVRMPWLLLLPAALLLHPLVDFVVMIRMAGSHDTPPGSGLLPAAALLVAAAGFAGAAARETLRRRGRGERSIRRPGVTATP